MQKRIVIEYEIEDVQSTEATADKLFQAAIDGVSNPIGFFGMAKYKILHQYTQAIRPEEKAAKPKK